MALWSAAQVRRRGREVAAVFLWIWGSPGGYEYIYVFICVISVTLECRLLTTHCHEQFRRLLLSGASLLAGGFSPEGFLAVPDVAGETVGSLAGGATGRHFGSDRTFIAAVGRATDMVQVCVEVREYFEDPQNRGWLRQVADVRGSTRRVKTLARRFLPDSGGGSLPPWTKEEATAQLSSERRAVG